METIAVNQIVEVKPVSFPVESQSKKLKGRVVAVYPRFFRVEFSMARGKIYETFPYTEKVKILSNGSAAQTSGKNREKHHIRV